MARVTVFDKFSEKTKQEINNIVKKQENALDMIVNNYYFNDVNYSSNDVCNRFQVENFALNPDENTLQTSGRDGWWQMRLMNQAV